MAGVNFGPDSEDVQESQRKPEITYPYCGNGYLNDVFGDEYGDNDKKVLVFQFVGTDDEKFMGEDKEYDELAFRKVEWPPREQDLEEPEGGGDSPFQNAVKRIVYIAKYFLGEETAIKLADFEAPTADDYWEKLRARVISAFEDVNYSEKPIRFKLVGNVYQGNARLQMPRYLGFMSDENSEEPVSFNDGEKQDNREFISAVSETPDSSEDFDEEGDDELEF